MKVRETPLKDCLIIDLEAIRDDRGFFMESFNQSTFKAETGIDFNVKQVNYASSSKDVLRGLHYQEAPFAQGKLVGVTRGAVLDVVVDLREDSSTYLKSFATEIRNNETQLFIPKGFAHGYLVLEDDTMFYYFVDEFYSPSHEKGLLYNDPELNINWELKVDPIVSEKDLNQPGVSQIIKGLK